MPGAETLPTVRLEVHQAGRTVPYWFDQVDFLIGTVPGCDLRVPGAGLPAVLCLLARHPSGVHLRRLAATQVLLLNGISVSRAELQDGDRLSLGALDLYVRFEAVAAVEVSPPPPPILPAPTLTAAPVVAPVAAPVPVDESRAELEAECERLRAEIAERNRRQLTLETARAEAERKFAAIVAERSADADALDGVRIAADQRLAELKTQHESERQVEREAWESERAAFRQVAPQVAIGVDLLQREIALANREADANRRAQELDVRTAEIERQRQEMATLRNELNTIRTQLHDRYQERRDRLAGLKEAVDHAARKVQEQKRDVEESRFRQAGAQQELDQKSQELDAHRTDLTQRERELADRQQLVAASQEELRAALEAKLADVTAREDRLASQRQVLEARERQYETDVVRLDRLQGSLDQRERDLAERSQSLQSREQQLLGDSAELENQAHELDRLRTDLDAESARLDLQKSEQAALDASLTQRAAALEGQQTALAGLRSRLERIRDEMRQQEMDLEAERTSITQIAADSEAKRIEAEQLFAETTQQSTLLTTEREQMAERQAVLADAVGKLRETQDRLGRDEQHLREQTAAVERRIAEAAEKDAIVEARLDQLTQAQTRLDAERQTLRERSLAVTQAEQAREALQEQLRRRGDELAQKAKELADRQTQLAEKETGLAAQIAAQEAALAALDQEHATRRESLARDLADIERRRQELTQLEELQRRQIDELAERGRQLAEQDHILAEQQTKSQEMHRSQQETLARERTELAELARQGRELLLELPDVELRAGTAIDRLSHAREQLRDHLAELTTYVRQAQDDLESSRARVQHDHSLLDRKEQDLRRLQDEHRLALVGFRQQVIDRQGQLSELQRLLGKGEKGLENRHAKVEDQARRLDEAAQELARDSALLEVQQRTVTEQRGEIDRQFLDLRDWYRGKLRELAGIPVDAAGEPLPIAAAAMEDRPGERDILSLTGPLDVGDRALGTVLAEHQLVDGDTLHALLVEARRQRRSLRQIILASGVVTVYQLALIETGNVSGLMLGPFRVIDRIRQTGHETVYRVFDPRRGSEALLRHLDEEDAVDAVLPDEFRERFRHLTLADAHVAGTLEVLDIGDRPAAVLEWLTGLPASDWPPLAAAPGVCYRLLTQAALGLAALHKQGLVHGRLGDSNLLLTPQGVLKLCGAGEPSWLHDVETDLGTAEDDLRALGRLVAGWCSPSGVRKGSKARPLPERMVAIVDKLQAEAGYESARALLDDLDRAGSEIPPNPEAWDRLLRYVRDHAMPEATLRQSA
jgi:trichohyalin